MKNYYCLIVVGDISKIEDILSMVIDGRFTFKNLGKLFISTFESSFSIWEIEKILHGNMKSYFLTKMQGHNFTASVQDEKIQNDLFLDYINKLTKENDEINQNSFNVNFTDIPNFDDRLNNFLNSIKNNPFENKSNKQRRKKKEENQIPPTLDELLDKINKVGFEKLTKFEKECLEKYSKNQ